jgi:uncharacterized DUF497 family protein
MSVPTKVLELVERFDQNLEAYRQGKYNETQVRLEFINPFFEQLGWDIANKRGYAEAYKEVVHEDAIKVGGATKAPDYSFRIGGVRKFFLEAKKPAVDIKYDTHPAYQLRRYAWSAKLPLSILTDFEEFAVYDNRDKHDVSFDEAATVFRDPKALSIFDPDHSDTEDRWITMGISEKGRLLIVIHAFRQENDNAVTIRIISSRKAIKQETKAYGE